MGNGLDQNMHFVYFHEGNIDHQHSQEYKGYLEETFHKVAEFIQLHWSWFINSIGAWFVTTWFGSAVF